MSQSLIRWARGVKARRASRAPVLWLFTDAGRLPEPMAAIRALPRGLAGVVHRPEGYRLCLSEAVAALCRARGLPLTVAGDPKLAARLKAGLHLRGGRGHRARGRRPRDTLVTGSAHNPVEARRCRAARVDACFISPVFATDSHPSVAALKLHGWQRLRRFAEAPYALGGIDDVTARQLPRQCCGAGAIGVFA